MNLCGSIIQVAESDQLLLEIPDENYQMTPRRKATSSAPSRRKTDIPGSIETDKMLSGDPTSKTRPASVRGNHRPPSTASLSSLAKDNSKSSRRRSLTTNPRTKPNSESVFNLEKGYNVTLQYSNGEKGKVKLDVNLEKNMLRVVPQTCSSSDSENDCTQSNQTEIWLKMTDITRLEVGREKATKRDSLSPRPVKTFTIVMRKKVVDMKSFNFEAESPSERDQIISGIKGVLDMKIPSSLRSRKQSASPGIPSSHEQKDKTLSDVPAFVDRKQHSWYGQNRSDTNFKKADYFDFDISNECIEVINTAEARSDGHERHLDNDREAAPSSDEELSSRDHEESAVVVARTKWTVEDLLCGLASGAMDFEDGTKPTTNNRTSKDEQRLQRRKSEKNDIDGYGCNPMGGCDSNALSAVHDIEMANIANEVSATPFCTDDVCTASLKDFADTMKGIFELKQNSRENRPKQEQQRAMAEDYISGVLGAPTNAVANLLSVKDMWTATKTTLVGPKRRVLENRSRRIGKQALRLKSLRKQMTFAAANSEEKIPFVQIVSSYDDVDRGERFAKPLTSEELQRPSRTDSSHFLKNPKQLESIHSSEDSNEEILYYDSDPEDARESAFRRGPRRALAERKNLTPTTKPRREALSEIPPSRISLSRRLRRGGDDEYVTDMIEMMKNEKMTLLWHPAQTKEAPNRAPSCVSVWIESGIYLIDGTFLLPKLTWVPVTEESLDKKILNITLSNPATIDLLEVCRIRECKTIDRSIYPYANPDRSFLVRTQTEVQLFEARSTEERTRIVNGMRLLVARLASLLMLRDLRAVEEFFGGNSVPGDAPSWTKGKEDRPTDPLPAL